MLVYQRVTQQRNGCIPFFGLGSAINFPPRGGFYTSAHVTARCGRESFLVPVQHRSSAAQKGRAKEQVPWSAETPGPSSSEFP